MIDLAHLRLDLEHFLSLPDRTHPAGSPRLMSISQDDARDLLALVTVAEAAVKWKQEYSAATGDWRYPKHDALVAACAPFEPQKGKG